MPHLFFNIGLACRGLGIHTMYSGGCKEAVCLPFAYQVTKVCRCAALESKFDGTKKKVTDGASKVYAFVFLTEATDVLQGFTDIHIWSEASWTPQAVEDTRWNLGRCAIAEVYLADPDVHLEGFSTC